MREVSHSVTYAGFPGCVIRTGESDMSLEYRDKHEKRVRRLKATGVGGLFVIVCIVVYFALLN
ncbi:hypothetical protein CVV67_10615 [Arthrobacter stackebrandtii]|nr:hypothetical protein CVV67_10615 [Arthrobacter stackebrandtii]